MKKCLVVVMLAGACLISSCSLDAVTVYKGAKDAYIEVKKDAPVVYKDIQAVKKDIKTVKEAL